MPNYSSKKKGLIIYINRIKCQLLPFENVSPSGRTIKLSSDE